MINKAANNKKYYLVEDYDPVMDYSDGTVIALTPEACYGLKKAGVAYNIVEDFYDEKALKYDQDRYFSEQLKWVKGFDEFLNENIAYCKTYDINLPSAHFMRLKYFIDSIVIHTRVLQEVILKIKPDIVVYVRLKKSDDPEYNMYHLYNNERRFFLELSILLCKKYSIPVSVRYNAVGKKNVREVRPAAEVIKTYLKRLHCKSAYYLFKYNKLSKFAKRREAGADLKLLALHAGSLGMDIIIRKSIKRGVSVFIREENRIILISDIIQKTMLDLTDSEPLLREKISGDCVKAFNDMLTGKDVIGWINDKCALDVTGLIAPYFKYFIEEICFHNILEIILLKEFYKNEKIDFVISRSSTEEDSVAAFLAAADLKGRVCFQHGIMYDTKVEAISELDLTDYYFTMDDISHGHFKDCSRLDYVSECGIFQSSHYLKAISGRWRNVRRPKKTIMYVPTRLFAGLNVFNVNLYPLTLYYEFQKSVIDLFGNMKTKNFIYKSTSVQEWSDNSLSLYIAEKDYRNIRIEKRPLVECLGIAGKIIFDYPSTGFYEAAVCGIPAMSLCHETFKIDNEVKEFFGKSIQDFSTIPQAIRRIEYFMSADQRDFIVDIPLSDDEPIDILRKIKNREM